jgi:hypothetical protein
MGQFRGDFQGGNRVSERGADRQRSMQIGDAANRWGFKGLGWVDEAGLVSSTYGGGLPFSTRVSVEDGGRERCERWEVW